MSAVYCMKCGAKHEVQYGEKVEKCIKCGKSIADIVTPEQIIKTIQTQPAVKSPTKDKTKPKHNIVMADDEEDDIEELEVPIVDEINISVAADDSRRVKLGDVLGTNVGGEVVARPNGKLKSKKALLKEQADLFKPAKSEEII